ncbi:putative repeat protein (TIGR02543 family) [Hymenobacter sp. UYAg731]
MKLLLAVFCTGLAMLAGPGTLLAQSRILFVGNSFTHGYVAPALNYNSAAITDENYGQPTTSPRHESDDSGPWGGVPGIFKKFTDEAGLAYEVHIEAINGVDLTYHYTNALSVIRQAGWDKVVLQELSTAPLPVNKGGNQADFFNYTTQLEQAIHSVNAAAKVYLYETWARADLTYPAGQPYSGQPITAMGTDLHNGYNQAFTQNGHFEAVAPVGDAWQLAMQTGVALTNPYNPTAGKLDLWSNYFHASKWGSYLSACVLLYQIAGVDPRTLGAGETAAADLGIAPADAVALQQVAYNQVNTGASPSNYSLTVTAAGSGTVAKSPDQPSYASGTSVSLTATPAAGFTFTGWSGDAMGTASPLLVTVTANKTITATFTAIPPTTYTLTTNVVGTGTVAKNPSQASYASGASVSLTATPGTGYTFTGWSGDATGTANPLTVTMTANKAITATFTPNGQSVVSYTLVNTDTNVDIQIVSTGAVLNLATLPTTHLNVRANTNPSPVGSVVFALRGTQTQNQTETSAPYALFGDNGAGKYNSWTPAVGSYTLTATPYSAGGGGGTAGTPLSISFSVSNQATTASYALTVSTVGSGTVTKSPDQASYASGTNLSLTATPATGYQFSGWSGDATGATNPLSVTMTSNKTITATFTAIPPMTYTLTTNAVGTGTVAKSPSQTSYASGASVALTATPGTGYTFTGWSGDATGTTNPLTVTMTANKVITATFTAASGTGLTFYRALNINGNALVLDGQNWEAATGAANFTVTGTRFANQNVTLNPATDALRAGMIRSSVYGPSIDATLRNVPAGTYAVYAYVWEDNSPETFSVRVQGQIVLASYNSGAVGRWSRLGPYTAPVTSSGTLVLSTAGGYANLSGVEVWRQSTAGAARTALLTDFSGDGPQPAPSASSPVAARLGSTTGIATPQVFPNPTSDGRLWILLPDEFQGPVAYSLVSVVGAKLASGQLTGATQRLDFSRELTASGLYYLLLKGWNQRAQIKLVRP